jgi:hypothetical protein
MANRSDGSANGGSLSQELDELGRLISQAASDHTVLPNVQSDTALIPDDAPLAPPPAPAQSVPHQLISGESAEPRQRRRPALADSRLAQRDARGRFSSNGDGDSGREDEKQRRWFGEIGDRLAEAVMSSATGVEEVDPTIKAFNEVAQPLARGYQLFMGGDKETRWYKRIFGELRLFRRDQTVFNRAEQRALREISENTENQGGGSGESGAGGLLPLLMVGAKGLLKKVPVLGAVLGGFGAASDISETEADSSLTRQQKDERNGKSIGGAVGSLGGMLGGAKLGAMAGSFLGPVGTAVGGGIGGVAGLFLGDQVGQMLGEVSGFWINEIREADFSGKWDRAVDDFKIGWQTIVEGGQKAFDWMREKGNDANEFIKDKTGVDVNKFATTDVVTPAIGYAKESGNKANAFVKDKTGIDVRESVQSASGAAKSAYQSAKTIAHKSIIEPAAHALSNAKDWVLGQTSRWFESGKGGAGTVSTGKGDLGGASYGTYQLSSKQGTLQKFLKSSGYGAQFEGLEPGTKAFNQRWKEIAQQDPSFGNAQHDFIQRTHFDPQVEKLKKAGIEVSGRGKAVQDAIWSTSVQFGGNSSVIERALQGQDSAKLSDAEFVSAIQDYKIAHNDRLFSRSSRQVKAGTLNRALNEKTQLLTLASLEGRRTSLPQMPTQTVSSVSPVSPAIPHAKPTAIAEAPPILMPLSSGPRKNLSISIDKGDVGQDISDRRLAHIITGGLST